ncbi:MAG: hypothetical protein FD136_1714 [Chitinophagaceae bacterium]|nr:MAG: hypothetical protein FD136_1714 [Chitinophagaceae bacterium]
MKKLIAISGLFLAIALTSCTKQVTSPTQGQITAVRLQRIIKVGEPVYVYNVDGTSTQGSMFEISSDGYITIAYPALKATYNLGLLKEYKNVVLSNGNNWFLYF